MEPMSLYPSLLTLTEVLRAYARDLQRRLSEMGYICRLQRPVKSKITRFAPFGAVAEAGYVQVVEAEWNKEFFTELEQFGAESGLNSKMISVTPRVTPLHY